MLNVLVAASVLALHPTPDQVAAAVAANEALYRDIDVTYSARYHLAGDRLAEARAAANAPPRGETRAILEKVTVVRVTHQGGMFRAGVIVREDTGDGEPRVRTHAAAYDGEKTRTRDGGKTAEAAGPRTRPAEAHFPHLWATAPWLENFALSDFVAGGGRWDRLPDRASGFKEPLTSTVTGPAAAGGGEPCVVVRCHLHGRPGQRGQAFVFWLAVRRNYLPVRTEKYAESYSATLPIEAVECGDLRELRPGVWLPHRLTRTVYDERKLRAGAQTVINITQTTLTRVDLAPRLDRALFRDMTPER